MLCNFSIHYNIRDEYYAWGLHRIAKAVSFLNNDCGLVSSTSVYICYFNNYNQFQLRNNISLFFFWVKVHGNVCLESVVVTQTLDWKLHAFDVLSEFDGNNETASGPMLVVTS